MIIAATADTMQSVRTFLTDRAETCQFLLAGLAEHGPTLTDHINSGNFRCVLEDGSIRCVFALYRRGNLVIQDDGSPVDPAAILDACAGETIPLVGVVGPWDAARVIWEEALRRDPALRETYRSREVLYRLILADAPSYEPDQRVRPLEYEDFDAYQHLSQLWFEEEGLPVQGTALERRQLFRQRVDRGESWGLVTDGVLVSTGVLVSRHDDTGVVGGIFTDPAHRRRGSARAIMRRLIHDSAHVLGLSRLILFTGEENVAARSMYEPLGFEHVGHYGLLFGTRLPAG